MSKVMPILIVAAALGVATPGYAEIGEANGAAQIQRGEYSAAEALILREQRLFPHDADLLLNLANVYRHTARADAARAIYRRVMAAPDEMLDTDRDAMSAHAIARRELALMDALAAR